MAHLADLAESLDDIRDEVIELEQQLGTVNPSDPQRAERADSRATARLHTEIVSYNAATERAISEILRIQASLDDEG